MKTEELISKLSEDLSPSKGADSILKFLMKGLGVFILMALVIYGLLPVRADFSFQLQDSTFPIETTLWFLTGLFSALTAYTYSIPGLSPRYYLIFTSVLFLALLLFIFFGSSSQSGSIKEEMNLVKGICGGIISIISIIGSIFFFKWSTNNAPTRPGSNGFWIVLSTSCLGSTFMQIICAHDSGVHLYIWHLLPTMLLSILGIVIGKRILNW
jgi:hypothetical protein